MRKTVVFVLCILVNTLASIAQETKLTELHNQIDRKVNIRDTKSLRIGISSSNYNGGSSAQGTYIDAVVKAGGYPIIIPTITDVNALRDIISDIDGLVLIGGIDFDPLFYGEDPIEKLGAVNAIRDTSDITIMKLAVDHNVPILGICRGEQGLNIALGGTLYQDIPSQINTPINHNQVVADSTGMHLVNIKENSRLAKILGCTSVLTNTYHHQSVKDVAPCFKAVAHSEDSVIEAIEGYPHRNILAVQWHPEKHVANGDTVMLNLFKNLLNDASTYKQAKNLHKKLITIDSHVDTPLRFKQDGYNFASRDSNFVNLPKMQEGKLDAVFMAAYIGQKERDEKGSTKAVEYISTMLKQILLQATLHPDLCGIATNKAELIKLKAEGKKALFLGVENGYGIGKDISNLKLYYDLGVRYMTLCHTKDNDICDTSSQTENEWGGLSPFGKKVIKEMNDLGMMIDVSHVGISTFDDVIKLSKRPIIASHSSVRELCEHDRNLTDDQIRAIAKNGGVIQVCMVDLFINPDNPSASLEDAMSHIDHIVRIAGIDHVGIGSDFDGGGRLIGLEGTNDLINITIKLIERGYSEEDIEKIWGGNLLRVLEAQ